MGRRPNSISARLAIGKFRKFLSRMEQMQRRFPTLCLEVRRLQRRERGIREIRRANHNSVRRWSCDEQRDRGVPDDMAGHTRLDRS